MIGNLTGKILRIADDHIILDVAGVGYIVYLTSSVLHSMTTGEVQSFIIETRFTGSDIRLYGFMALYERDLFQTFLKVQGLGDKTVVNIMGHSSLGNIVNAIVNNDIKFLTALPGIGKKMAARMVSEFSHNPLELKQLLDENAGDSNIKTSNEKVNELCYFATEALLNMGYSSNNVAEVLSKLTDDDLINKESKIEDILRESIKRLL